MTRRELLAVIASGSCGLAGCTTSSCPPALHAQKINQSAFNSTDEEVFSYQQFSEKRQREFRKALETGNTEINETKDEWTSTRYVNYSGEYYRTSVSVC